jgi:tRNA(Ile)-lysidine synthase
MFGHGTPLPNPSPARGEALNNAAAGSESLYRALLPLPEAQLVVGFSGGLDSTAMLHALAASTDARARGLRAVHVHHGLHPDADAWAAHCERVCTELVVPLQVLRVQVDHASGRGPEGAARAARLQAFRATLGADEVLALAHHRDDQAETVLLRLLRGAGGDGLAAMRRRSRLGTLHLWRPLLGLPRSALREHATAHALHWIEDPSNADARYDRNFLRHRVLPVLAERWPHATRNLARSAALLAEQSQLLAEITATQLDALQIAVNVLSLSSLLAQPRAQRARILRMWLARLNGHVPPASIVAAIERDLLAARGDGDACVEWAGVAVHRWRDQLHALNPIAPLPTDWSARWDGRSPLRLPDGALFELRGQAPQDSHAFEEPLTVRARQGGERIRLPGRDHSHALKHVLQERDVPPWIRARMPLLFADDGELLAAGDGVLSARMDAWLSAHGARLRWLPDAGDATD